MQQSYLDFCNEVSGYTFHNKITKKQVYRFQMYWNGLAPYQCFQNYDTKVIVKQHNV